MKKIKLVRKEPPSDDEAALAIGREVLRLCKAQRGGFRLHVWFTGVGIQANYSEDGKSWTPLTRYRVADAILGVLRLIR